MLENLIVILLVIGLSYLFRQNSNDTFNTQMLFILLSLGGIIFYKIIYLQHYVNNKEMFVVDREPFQNNLNSVLNTFNTGTHTSNRNEQHNSNTEKIDNLENMVLELKNILNASKNDSDSLGNDSIDTSTMEVLRNSELNMVENEINELQRNAININQKKYPKIPVYNSCIIEEASSSSIGDNPSNDNSNNPKQTLLTKEQIEINNELLENNQKLLNSYKESMSMLKDEMSNMLNLDLEIN